MEGRLMLSRYDNFFTQDECKILIDEVLEYKSQWKFNPLTQYRTLGNSFFSSSVRVESNNTFNYSEETATELKVYNLFKNKLSDVFTNVEFTKSLGKPGYTIILPNQPKSALWHYDNELSLFPFNQEFKDYNNNFHAYFEKFYTFVLMLSDGKYSFDYYPETLSQYKNSPNDEMSNYLCKDHVKLVGDECPNPNCNLKEYTRINYNQGTLLIQEERFLHRASPAEFENDNDLRIIVRGYGVMKNNVVYIFW
jgi:hypothetical protein|tara:strand:+ start:1397 stop:2149 length:753 start_codon:yes stop_codon:yes gene_type:complete